MRDRERFASRRGIRQDFDKPTLSPRQSVRKVSLSSMVGEGHANVVLTSA
jgi:hypothetical protein